MSLETSLYAVLYSVGTRVYPDVAPANASLPFMTWQQIGGVAPTYLERVAVDARHAMVQVNVWAKTRAEANTIAQQVEAALTTANTLQASPIGAFIATHDEETNEYGTTQDFSIWSTK